MSVIEFGLIWVIITLVLVICVIWVIIENNGKRNKRLDQIEEAIGVKRKTRLYSSGIGHITETKLTEIEERLDNLPQSKAKVINEKMEEVKELIEKLEKK